jgi:hypothetical protein
MTSRTRWLVPVAGVAVAVAAGWPGGAGAQDPAPITGAFSAPFAEPTIAGVRTDMKCIRRPPRAGLEPSGPLYTPYWDCKPAAVSSNVTPLPNRIVYWNGLEGTENINAGIAAEFGTVAVNDQSRALDLDPSNPFASRWSRPSPVDGGANPPPAGSPDKEFVGVPNEIGRKLDPAWNDGALFCADNNFLPDGRVLATGGTTYKNDPPLLPGETSAPGPLELQGARNSRVYDPRTNTWQQTPKMNYGRWYPTIVTLGARGGRTGDTFVASGVKNLLKAYDKPAEPFPAPGDPDFPPPNVTANRTGDNVQETEVRDHDSGVWEVQGPKASQDPSDRPLPLFPRLHLLPNGHVYYNASGQVFNPAGESYNEALWNVAAAFDPATRRWNEIGVPGTAPDGLPSATAGFRGSTFSVMLPLRPDATGAYRRASFLTAGGILGTTPGTYLAITDSRIDTVDTGAATTASPSGTLTSRATGTLNQPRWYSSGTLLPTGEVLATSGAREDEVVAPGFETPVQQAEIFDPETNTWRRDATANRLRTYHNTAVLLPDARVLVGGHAPISFAYGRNMVPQDPQNPTRPYAGGVQGAYNQPSSKNDGRDPTMEIYTPPYLRTGRQQPSAPRTSLCHPQYGGTMELELSHPASEAQSVVLVRNPAVTHVVDGDQRTVELPIVGRSGNRVVVRRPPNANVAPPGPYMLFANRRTADGPIPSRAAQVFVGPDACPIG